MNRTISDTQLAELADRIIAHLRDNEYGDDDPYTAHAQRVADVADRIRPYTEIPDADLALRAEIIRLNGLLITANTERWNAEKALRESKRR